MLTVHFFFVFCYFFLSFFLFFPSFSLSFSNFPAFFPPFPHFSRQILMDFHAHLASTEIIGLLGGVLDIVTNTLNVLAVFPCNSISTGMQCEIDPTSQIAALDAFLTYVNCKLQTDFGLRLLTRDM